MFVKGRDVPKFGKGGKASAGSSLSAKGHRFASTAPIPAVPTKSLSTPTVSLGSNLDQSTVNKHFRVFDNPSTWTKRDIKQASIPEASAAKSGRKHKVQKSDIVAMTPDRFAALEQFTRINPPKGKTPQVIPLRGILSEVPSSGVVKRHNFGSLDMEISDLGNTGKYNHLVKTLKKRSSTNPNRVAKVTDEISPHYDSEADI